MLFPRAAFGLKKLKTLAILHAAQLVTLAGPKRPRVGGEMRELGIIPDGAMLIQDGRIVKTGPSEEIEKALPGDAKVIDARGRVVLPGFVDAHAHPVFAGDRVDEFEMRTQGATYEQIAESGGGIRSTVRKTRAASGGRTAGAGEETRRLVSERRHDNRRGEVRLRADDGR